MSHSQQLIESFKHLVEIAGMRNMPTTDLIGRAVEYNNFEAGVKSIKEIKYLYIPFNEKRKEYRRDVQNEVRGAIEAAGYGYMPFDVMFDIVHDHEKIIGYVRSTTSPTIAAFSIYGPDEFVSKIVAFIEQHRDATHTPVVNRFYHIERNGRIDHKETTLAPPNENSVYSAMYPFMNSSPEQLWNEFVKSKSNVMLLIGPPGMGKSTFIRAMLDARGWDENAYLADNHGILADIMFPDAIRNVPMGSVIVTEDSDILVGKRENGNESMSAILNATSGLVSTGTKLIISTNLPSLLNVDSALLRPGRLFKALQFRHLTPDEAHALRAEHGLHPVDFGNNDKITLAEAFNWHDINGEVVKNTKIGFS